MRSGLWPGTGFRKGSLCLGLGPYIFYKSIIACGCMKFSWYNLGLSAFPRNAKVMSELHILFQTSASEAFDFESPNDTADTCIIAVQLSLFRLTLTLRPLYKEVLIIC